jgi:hypothetical protein
LNEVATSYMHNVCVISLAMVTFVLDIVLVGFLEISYHMPSIACKVIDAYEGECQGNILVYEFEYIIKKGRMCVIQDSISPG